MPVTLNFFICFPLKFLINSIPKERFFSNIPSLSKLADVRAFMDIMSVGDDEYLVERILEDPDLSNPTSKAIRVFSNIMKNEIRKSVIDENQYISIMHKILRKDVYKMPTLELLLKESEIKGILKGKIEICYVMFKMTTTEISKILNVPESEVVQILKELNHLP